MQEAFRMQSRAASLVPRVACGLAPLLALVATLFAQPAAAADEVLVFAAASTSGAIGEIAAAYAERRQGAVRAAFASSATLARQIAAAAPADVFLSAHPHWMDYLVEHQAIDRDSRRDLLRNRLVLIEPRESTLKLRIAPGFPLAEALGGGRLAIGNPEHVPAGMYAKAALVHLGVWKEVADRLAPAPDVRAALALVERGETPLGIVYASDARASAKVRVVGTFPADSHPPIVYPVAVVTGHDRPAVASFMAFLGSPEAREIFRRFGFGYVGR